MHRPNENPDRAGGAAGSIEVVSCQARDTEKIAPPRAQFNNPLIPSLRLRRCAETMHQLGPLALAYFVAEVRAGADVDAALEQYVALPADLIAAYGADRDTPSLFAIDGGRS